MQKLHTQNQLLDEISRACPWHDRPATDYRIGKLLNTSSSAVGHWRAGRNIMAPEFAMRAAELLHWPEAYVLACVEAERAERMAATARAAGRDPLEETNTIVRTWRAIGEHFKPGAAAGILLALLTVGMLLHPVAAQASTAQTYSNINAVQFIPYAKYGRRRRETLAVRLAALFSRALRGLMPLAGFLSFAV